MDAFPYVFFFPHRFDVPEQAFPPSWSQTNLPVSLEEFNGSAKGSTSFPPELNRFWALRPSIAFFPTLFTELVAEPSFPNLFLSLPNLPPTRGT